MWCGMWTTWLGPHDTAKRGRGFDPRLAHLKGDRNMTQALLVLSMFIIQIVGLGILTYALGLWSWRTE